MRSLRDTHEGPKSSGYRILLFKIQICKPYRSSSVAHPIPSNLSDLKRFPCEPYIVLIPAAKLKAYPGRFGTAGPEKTDTTGAPKKVIRLSTPGTLLFGSLDLPLDT